MNGLEGRLRKQEETNDILNEEVKGSFKRQDSRTELIEERVTKVEKDTKN
jgi:hypothetical protein